MNDSKIYKIKDSVDIFLSDRKYLMVYYMNTRQRKSFKINEASISLLEKIDGEITLGDLKKIMFKEYEINPQEVDNIIKMLIENKIITEKVNEFFVLSEYDRKRYDRQINYFSEFLNSEYEGLLAQKKLMDSKILIFGCGAIGGDIAIELVMAGVQNLILYDYDIVENSDVSRHLYYDNRDNGKKKVESLEKQLKQIDSRVKVIGIAKSMRPEENIEELIKGVNFVINTLDEPYIGYTAAKISRVCIKYKIPHYIAGGFDAHLASTGELIIPYITPCAECYADYFKKTLANWKPKKHPVKNRAKNIGGLSAMSLFSASFASAEVIKFIAGLVDMRTSYKTRGELIFNNLKLTYINVKRNINCPVCGEDVKL